MPRTTKNISISLDDPALKKGKRQARKRGFKQSFSAYVAHLINLDAAELSAAEQNRSENKEVPA